MVSQFLQSDAIKQYETDVFYDMFCLAFCPNGGWKENQGQARLSLKLCCLPNRISKIKVKMELLCLETETDYCDICDFAYDSNLTVRAWPTDMLLTPQLNGLNKLTFKCMVFIIAKYDQQGNEINNNNNNNHHDNNNDNMHVQINSSDHYINDDYVNDDDHADDYKDDAQDMIMAYDHHQQHPSVDANTSSNKLQSQIANITAMLDSLNSKIQTVNRHKNSLKK